MPRVPIPITHVGEIPVSVPAEVVADPTNDHELAYNDGRVWLEVRNTDASERGFIMITTAKVGELEVKNPQFDIPATTTVVIGPFHPAVYNQRDSRIFIDLDGTFLRFRAYHTN